VEDVAYRVVAGNLAPDHSTIAGFRCRHEQALGKVFCGVLGLCARVGLASVGVIAIDGTKMSADASVNANRDFEHVARAILREAAEIDEREDELYGDARGDELPEQLRTREGRRQALREAKQRLARDREQDGDESTAEAGERDEPVPVQPDPQRFVTRPQGRRAWLREGRRALDAHHEREARRFPTTGLTGCLRPVGAWRTSSMSTRQRTLPMRPGGRTAWPPTGRGGWRPA
jgi:hypothetical protein